MYGHAFTRYAEVSYRLLFRYADRFLHASVLEELAPSPDDEILEIGCDQGQFLRLLRARCRRGYGVDVNAAAVAAAGDPDISCMSATALAFPDERFDKIVSLHTLEHVVDLRLALREIARVLKPGGRAAVAYPLELIRGFSTLPSAIASHHDPLMARQMHVHKLLPSSLVGWLEGTGLLLSHSRLQLWPIPIVPVYVSVLHKPHAI